LLRIALKSCWQNITERRFGARKSNAGGISQNDNQKLIALRHGPRFSSVWHYLQKVAGGLVGLVAAMLTKIVLLIIRSSMYTKSKPLFKHLTR